MLKQKLGSNTKSYSKVARMSNLKNLSKSMEGRGKKVNDEQYTPKILVGSRMEKDRKQIIRQIE